MATNKWSALGTFTTAIAGASVAPTLKALANNGRKLGSEIDPTGAGDRNTLSLWQLLCRLTSAPGAGKSVDLYFILSADGTNYEYGDDSTDPPASAYVGSFPLSNVSTAQRITLRGVELPPCKFKPLLVNTSGQALTNTDNENVLSYRTYNVASV